MASEIDRHKLQRVADYRDDVVEQFLEYVNKFPQNAEVFVELFEELAWDNKYGGRYRNHLSLTAVPLATKIYDQYKEAVEPLIKDD